MALSFDSWIIFKDNLPEEKKKYTNINAENFWEKLDFLLNFLGLLMPII